MSVSDAIRRIDERAAKLTAERDERRERMRREYPDHARLFDLFARFSPCRVAIGGKAFGKALPDRPAPDQLMTVSVFLKALEAGLIKTRKQVIKRKELDE